MRFKKTVAVLLAALALLLSVPVYAEGSPAYTELAGQEPVFEREVTLSELEEYFLNASTDEILDPAECNYTYGEVAVSGVAELCHVYMRTFTVTDVAELTVYDMEALAKRIVSFVKQSSSSKYLKCIAKTYNARISSIVQGPGGVTDSITVKIFIACGEKTEDRAELKQGYIAQIADELIPLSDGERFIRLNELMLDGRFRYDMSYRHRCSAVALVSEGIGVCEEYAGFTSLVLDALGYENSIITGDVGGIPHMWNLVTINGRVYHLDILHNGPVDAEGVHTSVLRTYLLVSEQAVTATHNIAAGYTDVSSLALYDYIFEGYPTQLAGAVEKDGVKYLFADKTGMTAKELEEQLDAAGFLRMTADSGELNGDATAGSGLVIDIYVNGAVLNSYVLAVKGDADGDGLMTENDILQTAGYLLSDDLSDYDALFILCADLDGNGAVTVTDLIIAADTVNGYTEPDNGGEETETAAETSVDTEAEQ